MIWIILYLLFAFASGVIWFNIFKEKSEIIKRNMAEEIEIEYEISWIHILSFPCLIALSLIGFVIGLIVAADEDIDMPAFKIKVKKK